MTVNGFAGAPHPYARLRAAMAPDPSRWYYTGVWRDTGRYGNSNCACGHEIRYEFLIACEDDERTLVIGSTCIETNVPALIRDGARKLADDLQEANREFKRELRANQREIEADEAIPELLDDFRRLRGWCFDRRNELKRRRAYMPDVLYWVEQPPDDYHDTQSSYAAAIRRRYVSVWLKGAQALSARHRSLPDAELPPVPRQARLFAQLARNVTRLAEDRFATNHDGARLALAEHAAFQPPGAAREPEPTEPVAADAAAPTWLEGRLTELAETGIDEWARTLVAAMLAHDPRAAAICEVHGEQYENGGLSVALWLRPTGPTEEATAEQQDVEERWRQAEATYAALREAWPTGPVEVVPDQTPYRAYPWDSYVETFDEPPVCCAAWWYVADAEEQEAAAGPAPETDEAQAEADRDQPNDDDVGDAAGGTVSEDEAPGLPEEATQPYAGEEPDPAPDGGVADPQAAGLFSRWRRRRRALAEQR